MLNSCFVPVRVCLLVCAKSHWRRAPFRRHWNTGQRQYELGNRGGSSRLGRRATVKLPTRCENTRAFAEWRKIN